MQEVRDKLAEELKSLERELRVDLPQEIKTAVAMGDLRENAEYHAALDRQRFVRARIGQLRLRLTELSFMNMERIPRDRVGIGTTVTLLDLDLKEEIVYEIMIPELASVDQGRISIASPIGRGLLGKKEGERVVIPIPSGTRRYRIVEVRTLHHKQIAEAGGSE